jgi:hypothetical protein
MQEDPDEIGPRNRGRLIERLDRMVESGQVTATEATQLRAATDEVEFENAVRAIRVRHASAKLDAAVAGGHMTRKEAEGHLARLKNGEHPESLRADLAKLMPRSR